EGGVGHDHPSQIESLGGAEDRARVAPPGEERQPADMVEMGMADDDGVEVPAREHRNLPVLGDRPAVALIKPAIDQYAGALGGDLECGTGHVSGRSVEMDLHRRPSWSAPDRRRQGRPSTESNWSQVPLPQSKIAGLLG